MADAPLITGTDFVAVGTRDFDAAARFYGDVLGLPLGKRWGSMPAGDSGVCLQAFFEDRDGNALAIHHRYAPGKPPAASAGG